jgi:hypothetical protein
LKVEGLKVRVDELEYVSKAKGLYFTIEGKELRVEC